MIYHYFIRKHSYSLFLTLPLRYCNLYYDFELSDVKKT